VARAGKTAEASAAEAKLYAAKASQFLELASQAREFGFHDGAMLNAVHAAISATDAVTVALARRRSFDSDHQRAADLLEQVAGQSPELKTRLRQLRELLARKNAVEYESRRVTAREAADAVQRAERFVAWAVETVERAKL
jgi:HEPN domain-containing protein